MGWRERRDRHEVAVGLATRERLVLAGEVHDG